MNRLAIVSVAAGALLPISAAAAQTLAPPPVKWEDVPPAELHAPAGPPPGVTWQAPPPPRMMGRPQPPAAPPPPPIVQHHGPVRVETHAAAPVVVVRRDGDRVIRRHHRINGYPHYRRINRGFVIPHHWWSPAFQIRNWGAYGLPGPVYGGRWVRYYDDALMIDPAGRVLDGRWGMAWDEWDHEWGYDDRGIPAYVGSGDFYPGEEDYAWVEGEGRYADAPPPPPCAQGCAPPMPHGYPGYAYGYMWIPGGTITVTETIVTTEPQVVTERVHVERPHRAHQPRRVYRPKTKIIHRGERG